MRLANISFPVTLTQWQLAGTSTPMKRYQEPPLILESFLGPQESPGYDFGFAVVRDKGRQDLSAKWNVVWIEAEKITLQDPKTGFYLRRCTGMFNPKAGICDGKEAAHQMPNKEPGARGTFLLEKGIGNRVGIIDTRGGTKKYMGINYNNDWHLAGWDFAPASFHSTHFGSQEQFEVVGGSQFPVLLLTGSAEGLSLAGQDMAENGYLASVEGAEFCGANLDNASFASLADRTLAGCNFTGASVRGTDLSGCTNLGKAVFAEADLTGTDFSKVARGEAEGCNFAGAKLCGAKLTGVSFAGAEFSGADLFNADLRGANLSGANFAGADLSGALIDDANFAGACLHSASFQDCDLTFAKFDSDPDRGADALPRSSR